MKTIKPSWLLASSLDIHDNLFLLNDVQTNYIVDVYVCKCGKNEFIVRDEYKQKYICQRCRNSLFFNVEDFTANTNEFIVNSYYNDKIKLDFTCEFDIQPFGGKLQAAAVSKIPFSIDYINKKIFYKDIVINAIDFQAKHIPYQGSLPSSNRLLELANNQFEFEKLIDVNLLSKNENKRRKELKFFIDNFHFQDIEFMKWKSLDVFAGQKNITIEKAFARLSNNKKYKSVKKTIFLNYEAQMKKYKQFNPVMIDIATSRFTDPNHMVSILQLDFEPQYFDSKFDEKLNMYKYTYKFIDFLLERYTQKQVCNYLKKLENTMKFTFDIYYDTLIEFNYSKSILKEDFRKVKCTPNALHDELVRVSSFKRYSYMFDKKLSYTTEQLKPAISLTNGYTIKVPQNGAELYMWADVLHNCMASYFNNIQNHETIIYVFFKDNQIKFAVEIENNEIIQARGRYNSNLNTEENIILQKWFNKYFAVQNEIAEGAKNNNKVSLETIEEYINKVKNKGK